MSNVALSNDMIFKAFKHQFENNIRKELEHIVLHISRGMIEKAVQEVVSNMEIALVQSYRDFSAEFVVRVIDDRKKYGEERQ